MSEVIHGPTIIVMASSTAPTISCLACKRRQKPGESFQHCGGCKAVYYCGPECQRKDWRGHKDMCKETCFKKTEALANEGDMTSSQ